MSFSKMWESWVQEEGQGERYAPEVAEAHTSLIWWANKLVHKQGLFLSTWDSPWARHQACGNVAEWLHIWVTFKTMGKNLSWVSAGFWANSTSLLCRSKETKHRYPRAIFGSFMWQVGDGEHVLYCLIWRGERMGNESALNVLPYRDWIQEAAGGYAVLMDKKHFTFLYLRNISL